MTTNRLIDEKYANIIRFAADVLFFGAVFILAVMIFYNEAAFKYFLEIFKFGRFPAEIYFLAVMLIGWEYYNFRFTSPLTKGSGFDANLAAQRRIRSDEKILKKRHWFTFQAVTLQIIEEIIFRGLNLMILFHFGFFWAAAAILPISFIWGFGHLSSDNYKYGITSFDLRWRLAHNTVSGIFYSILTLATGGIFLSASFHGGWNLAVGAREIKAIISFFKKNPR